MSPQEEIQAALRAAQPQRRNPAADLLLEGLAREYPHAVATGRLSAWAALGHSIVDLLACEEEPKR